MTVLSVAELWDYNLVFPVCRKWKRTGMIESIGTLHLVATIRFHSVKPVSRYISIWTLISVFLFLPKSFFHDFLK